MKSIENLKGNQRDLNCSKSFVLLHKLFVIIRSKRIKYFGSLIISVNNPGTTGMNRESGECYAKPELSPQL